MVDYLQTEGIPFLLTEDGLLVELNAVVGPTFIKIAATGTTGSSGTVTAATLTSAVPAGNTLVIALNSGADGTVASATDTKGNTYVIDRNSTSTTGGQLVRCHVTNALAAGDVITVTRSVASSNHVLIAAEYAGLATDSFDQVASTSGTSASPTATSPATTQSPEVVVGTIGLAAVTGNISGVDPSWTEIARVAAPSARMLVMYSKVVDATGAQALSGTLDISTVAWRVTVSTYKGGL